jgi:hypothetical protein
MGVCASAQTEAPVPAAASTAANPATKAAGGPSSTEARAQSMVRRARANIYTQVTISQSYDKVVVPKGDDVTAFLSQVIEEFHMFQDLDHGSKTDLVNAMAQKSVPSGTNLIEQGDAVADYFYVVDSGEFQFRKDGVVVGDPCRRGQIFGELALLYGCPRAATVRVRAPASPRARGARQCCSSARLPPAHKLTPPIPRALSLAPPSAPPVAPAPHTPRS